MPVWFAIWKDLVEHKPSISMIDLLGRIGRHRICPGVRCTPIYGIKRCLCRCLTMPPHSLLHAQVFPRTIKGSVSSSTVLVDASDVSVHLIILVAFAQRYTLALIASVLRINKIVYLSLGILCLLISRPFWVKQRHQLVTRGRGGPLLCSTPEPSNTCKYFPHSVLS